MCPNSTVTMPDQPFSDLRQIEVLFSLCAHLEDNGISLKGVVWTSWQSKTGLSISIVLALMQFWSYGCGSKHEVKEKSQAKRYTSKES